MVNVIEELIHDAEKECETSAENIRGLNEIKIQHEKMFTDFKVNDKKIKFYLFILINRNKLIIQISGLMNILIMVKAHEHFDHLSQMLQLNYVTLINNLFQQLKKQEN